MAGQTRTYDAIRYSEGKRDSVHDNLCVEHPLAISVNGKVFTLTMQTPGHEHELARGLLFAEGVYRRKTGELASQVTEVSETGYVSAIEITIDEKDLDVSQINKRNLLSVASCGICGKTELQIPEGQLGESGALDQARITAMFTAMAAEQDAFLSSGGSHASAVFDRDGALLVLREDIGRHNAVDKVIGHLLNSGTLNRARYLLVSGRVSYEIVTKCFSAGIPFLLAVSAPSSLAVDFAKELGITLFGFCRETRATVYAHPERVS
ncbi:MAG: formate dehydrogenase accessory sulfurtransferase FdhD [Flavobacteriales bacterium]|nr:formate dehydrogenase accessory sulfurtransferase FdhD [Flavobacteriales bacterium]